MAPGIKCFHVPITEDLKECFLDSVPLSETGIGFKKRGKPLLF